MIRKEIKLFSLFFLIGCIGYWYPTMPYAPRASREVFVHFIIWLSFGYSFIRNQWIRYFWLCCVVGVFYHHNIYNFFALYKIATVFAFYIIIDKKVQYGDCNTVFNFICVLVLINVIYAYWQALGKTSFVISFPFDGVYGYGTQPNGMTIDKTKTVVAGLMHNPNQYAALIGLGLPCFMRRKWIYCIVFILPTLFLNNNTISHTRTGQVMCLFVLMFFSYYWICSFNKVTPLTITVIYVTFGLLVLVYSYKHGFFHSFGDRIVYWQKTIKIMELRDWLIGAGPGSFRVVKPVKSIVLEAHNEYVQSLFELGVVSIVMIVGYIMSTVIEFIKSNKDKKKLIVFCGLVCLGLNCITNFTFHIIPLALLGFIYISMWNNLIKGGTA